MRTTRRSLLALRSAVKANLPPVLVEALRERSRRYYPSFSSAREAASGDWQSDELTRFRIEEAIQNIPLLKSNELPPGYSLLLAAMSLTNVAAPRVCDLGGGCGAWGYRLRQDIERPFVYSVVEHEPFAAACNVQPFFSWGTWVSELPEECDVLVCSGTLQYLEHPSEVLRRALKCTKHLAIIARTTFCEKDYAQVQVAPLRHNGHRSNVPPGYDPNRAVYFPHRTVQHAEVLAVAAAEGFDVHLKTHTIPSALAPRAFEQDMVLTRRMHRL
jgi:putative methyltransferase (TIGR04325 family)